VVFGPGCTWLHQVHGADVVTVTYPGEHAGAAADAAVTATVGCTLAVRTADCAPVVLVAGQDVGGTVVGVVHAGWRGVEAGVLQAAVASMRSLGADGPIRAVVGPCIHTECYEFGAADLAPLVARYGGEVEGRTVHGRPALDVRAAVTAALQEVGVGPPRDDGACTACAVDRYYSHRARGELERFATTAWIEP
jgi:YfiH family protein